MTTSIIDNDYEPFREFENVRVKRVFEEVPDTLTDPPAPVSQLDTEHSREILSKLREWWDQARQLQADNREEQSVDHDFYDGLQWDDEDAAELIERNQAPYVFNLVKPSVDWIIGTEKRNRVDFRVHAREDSPEARLDAQNKTKILKYLADVNRAPFARSRAFAESVKSGVGWLEDGIHNDESDELIFSRAESWRNIWYDALSIEPDLSDARFLFRARWLDLDYLIEMFPHRTEQIRNAAEAQTALVGDDETDDFWFARMLGDSNGNKIIRRGWLDEQGSVLNKRERVRPIECWYRIPERVQKMRGFDAQLNGLVFDQSNPAHLEAEREEIVSLHDALVMRMWVAIFAGNSMLQNIRSPYAHNDFPFTPVWAYRRGRDNAPYGIVRNIRDPQEDLNKRASKALYILSTNQILAEEGAVEPDKWDEIAEEAANPAGVVRLKNGALSGNRFQLNQDRQLAEEHLMMMDRDQALVRNVSGVQGENLGLETNAISGKAILAKQNEGSVVTFELFDNLRFAMQLQGEKQLSLVEQYMDVPKTIRLTGDRGKKSEFLSINQPEWDPLEKRFVFKNDLTARKADYIIDEQDFRATIRQAMFEQLMDMLGKLDSQIALQLLDIVLDMSDLPEKEQIVERIRKVNGQIDPEAQDDPAVIAEEQQKQQKAEEMSRLQIRDMLSKILEREAKAEKTRVDSQKAALEAGTSVAIAPGATGAADAILEAAGFNDNGAAQ